MPTLAESNYPDMPEIKTHDSESRGQEEAGCTQRTSELFTCIAPL